MENREELNPERATPAPQPSSSSFQPGLPPAAAESMADDELGADEAPLSLRYWFIANSIPLGIIALVLAFVLFKFRLEEVWAIAKAFLGLSFVVFIHEMGHFLVAKWCDVEVTTFSIGFGPAVPGCAWKWGETTYKLSLIPVGGYVQMVGQVDGEEASDGSEDNPRSFRNKSVGQRMAIISAGVIMNVILAIVVFIVVYQGPGKERPAGVVGLVDPAMPAFKYGVRTSATILDVGGVKNPNFEDLVVVVMSTQDNEQLKLVTELPGEPPVTVDLEPRLDKSRSDSKPMIGIAPPNQLKFSTRRGVDVALPTPARPGSPAASATPAFHFGDRIIACSDPAAPGHAVTALPDDPRDPGHGRRDYFAFERRMQLLAGETVKLKVERTAEGKPDETMEITVPPAYSRSLGVRMQMGQVSAIRNDSPAERGGVVARSGGQSRGRSDPGGRGCRTGWHKHALYQ